MGKNAQHPENGRWRQRLRRILILSGSIEVDDAEELTIDPSPDLYPAIVKRNSKLELEACASSNDDRCPLDLVLVGGGELGDGDA